MWWAARISLPGSLNHCDGDCLRSISRSWKEEVAAVGKGLSFVEFGGLGLKRL